MILDDDPDVIELFSTTEFSKIISIIYYSFFGFIFMILFISLTIQLIVEPNLNSIGKNIFIIIVGIIFLNIGVSSFRRIIHLLLGKEKIYLYPTSILFQKKDIFNWQKKIEIHQIKKISMRSRDKKFSIFQGIKYPFEIGYIKIEMKDGKIFHFGENVILNNYEQLKNHIRNFKKDPKNHPS